LVKAAFCLVLALVSGPALAQRLQGELACKPARTDFIYDCVIKLARNGLPLPGAQITVGADMPSMPMMHNVVPVQAMPGNTPGEYQARLDLEMLGEWAVKLRLRGPVNDQLILLYEFDEKGARPVRRGDRPPRK
jgi:hypothetical protein